VSDGKTPLGGNVLSPHVPLEIQRLEIMLQQVCSPDPVSAILTFCRRLYPEANWAFGQFIKTKRHWRSMSVPLSLISKIERHWPQVPLPNNVFVFPLIASKCTGISLIVLNICCLSVAEYRLLTRFFAYYALRLEQNSQYRQLDWAQNIDPLTGLLNRRAFEKKQGELLFFESRYSQQKIGFMVIDVNGLKQINDTQGHLSGDDFLRNIALWLRKICRKTDFIFRIGGDEFVVLLQSGTVDSCKSLSERLKQKKWANFTVIDRPFGVSCGWASTELHELNQLFNIADRNMYQQKRRFYNQFYQKQ
jgi:diguanylate cyclase (GGDEF)-like protein